MMKVSLMGHDMSKETNEPFVVFEIEIQRNKEDTTHS
jgi:hypothetical protein